MKKIFCLLLVAAFCLMVGTTGFAAEKTKMDLKAGDQVFACNCGDDCACKTMSKNAGKCT